MNALLSPAIAQALSIADLPDVLWHQGDDLCDCEFQRIGWWTNPYTATTHEIRLCCVWAELGKQYPEFVRTIPAFWDYAHDEWVTEPQEWNGEGVMPLHLWHRQLARKYGIPVAEARSLGMVPPDGITPRPTLFLKWGGEWLEAQLGG